MGRKIPGKKHRGVKDPYAQHAKRLASIKTKINKTPLDLDDQPVPKSLIRLMSWKTKDKFKLKKNKENVTSRISKVFKKNALMNDRPTNPVNKLKKVSGESNKSFNMRINDAMRSLKGDRGFDDIDEIAPEPKEKKLDEDGNSIYIQKKGRKRRPKTDEQFLTKSQRRTLKEKMKREKLKEEKELDQQYIVRKDDIKFGEIVHEPPSLKIKPRKADKTTGVPRPARKDLLLNKLFDKNNQSMATSKKTVKAKITIHPKKKSDGVIDLKGRRKDLPQSVRRKIEQSQKEAIEAYKLLKLEKTKKKT